MTALKMMTANGSIARQSLPLMVAPGTGSSGRNFRTGTRVHAGVIKPSVRQGREYGGGVKVGNRGGPYAPTPCRTRVRVGGARDRACPEPRARRAASQSPAH